MFARLGSFSLVAGHPTTSGQFSEDSGQVVLLGSDPLGAKGGIKAQCKPYLLYRFGLFSAVGKD
jgi:hypothetical protein